MPSRASGAAEAVVSDIWRFPVKSFAGERLRRAFAGPFGLIGDRRYCVVGEAGPLTCRRVHGLLEFAARYVASDAADGAVVTAPDGSEHAPQDLELVDALSRLAGERITVEARAYGFFDVAPVHLLGEASIAALGAAAGRELDRRRFRANLVVDAGPEPFAEDAWIGRRIAVGDAIVEVVVNTERCAVTTIDPETRERDSGVLTALARERDNLFGVYARVVQPGWIGVGDAITPDPA